MKFFQPLIIEADFWEGGRFRKSRIEIAWWRVWCMRLRKNFFPILIALLMLLNFARPADAGILRVAFRVLSLPATVVEHVANEAFSDFTECFEMGAKYGWN